MNTEGQNSEEKSNGINSESTTMPPIKNPQASFASPWLKPNSAKGLKNPNAQVRPISTEDQSQQDIEKLLVNFLRKRDEPSKDVVKNAPVSFPIDPRELAHFKETYLEDKRPRTLKPKNSRVLNFEWSENEDTGKGSMSVTAIGHRVKDERLKRVRIDDSEEEIELGSVKLDDGSDEVDGRRDDEDQNNEEKILMSKPRSELTRNDIAKIREANNINLKYNLKHIELSIIRSWEESGLHKNVLKNLYAAKRVERPTPIQMQAIPVSLEFKDIIGIAPTGSGKTFAFLLPLINFLYYMPRIIPEKAQEGPYAIVLGPTRELVIQLYGVFTSIAYSMGLRAKIYLGGRDRLEGVHEAAEVVFASVGRFKDLLENNHATLNQCFYVIIDEADLMIDMDLIEPLNYILENIYHENNKGDTDQLILKQEAEMKNYEGLYRVTQMYSATMHATLMTLAQKYLKLPVTISVGSDKRDMGKKQHLFELVTVSPPEMVSAKWAVLQKWLRKLDFQVIIFFNTKYVLDEVHRLIQTKTKYSAVSYHSGHEQADREKIVEDFRQGNYDIMLSTDLGGRGLDIEGINTVVSFDAPKNFETYVHRTGRTARAGRSGTCLALLTTQDAHLFESLKMMLEKINQQVPSFIKEIKVEQTPKPKKITLGHK
jgi:ATP-dependent RNA helicase DDX23/PRP28